MTHMSEQTYLFFDESEQTYYQLGLSQKSWCTQKADQEWKEQCHRCKCTSSMQWIPKVNCQLAFLLSVIFFFGSACPIPLSQLYRTKKIISIPKCLGSCFVPIDYVKCLFERSVFQPTHEILVITSLAGKYNSISRFESWWNLFSWFNYVKVKIKL
jgi:hypothetical protein